MISIPYLNGLVSLFSGIVGLRLFIIVRVFDLCFIILVIIRHGLFRSFRLAALVCLEIVERTATDKERIADQQPKAGDRVMYNELITLLVYVPQITEAPQQIQETPVVQEGAAQ